MLPAWLPDTITTDMNRVVSRALLWGLEGIELRTIGKRQERVPSVNEAVLRRRLADSELGATTVCPGLFEGRSADRSGWMADLILLDETIGFCRRIGCPIIVASSFAADGPGERDVDRATDALRRAGDRAGRAGVRLAIHHDGDDPSIERLAELITTIDHESIGLAWDPTASAPMDARPDSVSALVAARLFLLRYHVRRSPPADDIDWTAILSGLARAGFAGPVSLVLETDTTGPDGLKAATGLISRLRQARIVVDAGSV